MTKRGKDVINNIVVVDNEDDNVWKDFNIDNVKYKERESLDGNGQRMQKKIQRLSSAWSKRRHNNETSNKTAKRYPSESLTIWRPDVKLITAKLPYQL